jgi:hypothetical protein
VTQGVTEGVTQVDAPYGDAIGLARLLWVAQRSASLPQWWCMAISWRILRRYSCEGRPSGAAELALGSPAQLNQCGKFNEWHHGETGAPMGAQDQASPAGMNTFHVRETSNSLRRPIRTTWLKWATPLLNNHLSPTAKYHLRRR